MIADTSNIEIRLEQLISKFAPKDQHGIAIISLAQRDEMQRFVDWLDETLKPEDDYG